MARSAAPAPPAHDWISNLQASEPPDCLDFSCSSVKVINCSSAWQDDWTFNLNSVPLETLTDPTHMTSSKISGFGFERGDSRMKRQPRHDSFEADIPDERFRFKITFAGHRSSFKEHSGEDSCLIIVLGGRALQVTDCESCPLEQGDVIVVNGNIRYDFKNPQSLRLCRILFNARQFFADKRDLCKLKGFHALFDLEPCSGDPRSFRNRLHLSADELSYVIFLLTILKTEFDGKAEGWQTIIRGILLLLVAYLSRLRARQQTDTGTRSVRMIKVISFIHKHYRDPLRIEDLAKLAFWSPSQFRRNFKSIYQTTPIHFINQVRIHRACDLLKDPDKDITSIAFDIGFSSSSFFSTLFKQHLGETPSQYRRRKLAELDKQHPQTGFCVVTPSLPAAAPRNSTPSNAQRSTFNVQLSKTRLVER